MSNKVTLDFTGAQGSGKSTLQQLIERFLKNLHYVVIKGEIEEVSHSLIIADGKPFSKPREIIIDNEHLERGRDRLWCAALCHILSIEDIHKVLTKFNELRDD